METIEIKEAESSVVFTSSSTLSHGFTLGIPSIAVGSSGYAGIRIENPISVEEGKMEIDSEKLKVGKFYKFRYLGTEMVLQKSSNGSLAFYEVEE